MLKRHFLFGLGIFLWSGMGMQAETLVPAKALWTYKKGTSEASSPLGTWRGRTFDDSSWATGRAPFYYGENHPGGTVLPDMRNNYTSVFMRRKFQMEDPSAVGALELRGLCDDGFIAWINGMEVARYNMPGGLVLFSGTASSAVPEPVVFISFRLPDPSRYLLEGENVLTIQAFNVSLGSSDLVMDAELIMMPPDLEPPTVVRVEPAPGRVSELREIVVTFSEPVAGVDAMDLIVNGTFPLSVSGTGIRHAFTLAQPAYGLVEVKWSPDHGIIDFAHPPNSLEEASARAVWVYELMDTVAPEVVWVHPAAGKQARHLTRVEVRFSEPVTGVKAEDLRMNGQGASGVTGVAAGPYVFSFEAPGSGAVQVSWAPDHEIVDLAEVPNRFAGAGWNYTVNPDLPRGDVVINEIMASNGSGLRDEDQEYSDWVEIYNRGDSPVNLEGWSLTDDPGMPGQWIFPNITLGAGQYLIVFASGKDRAPASGRLHANFKLSRSGEYLGLYDADSPRGLVSEVAPKYPEQRTDFSYGRVEEEWRYFARGTPGAGNGNSALEGISRPVRFSVARGYFAEPFKLTLNSESPGAVIRFTVNGSDPTEQTGMVYAGPITVDRRMIVRAVAYEPNRLPSRVETHTYLMRLSTILRSLPAISVATDRNHLWGPTGIMEWSPRNTIHRGIAWERPVSVELIRPEDNGGFQLEAGLRIQGGDYVRRLYNPNSSPPFSKYSFRLYFRGDYGAKRLEYRLFPDAHVETFNRIVLRAGMNDHSNPYIRDELARRLYSDMGQVSSHGTFALFFLNGDYQGYYNPTERIDAAFLQSWHGGGSEWDLVGQFGEIREGDEVEWNRLKNLINNSDLSNPSAYQEVERRLDLVNFVDYLLLNIYAGTQDWPHNNWRAGRERRSGAKFRYYVWDAEWAFGWRNSPAHNTISTELNGDTDVGRFYRKLRSNPEFRLLFADRFEKHFFNGGALTEEWILGRHEEMRQELSGVLRNMDLTIERTWVPQRRVNVVNHLRAAGLLAPVNAPKFSRHGGPVPRPFELGMEADAGTIYYTTNGVDPRVALSGGISSGASAYEGTPIGLERSMELKARALHEGNWSALSEAVFEVGEVGTPLRIAEIMYDPPGGDAFEFLELHNSGRRPIDLWGMSFSGINYTFPQESILAPGGVLVLSSDKDPAAFAARYPRVVVAGRFGGNLADAGERIVLKNRRGQTVLAVEYGRDGGWPREAAGLGHSLELIDVNGDPNDPANWRASLRVGGTPKSLPEGQPAPAVILNELMAENRTAVPHAGGHPDWVELYNRSDAAVDLSGWSLSDKGIAGHFVFPNGTVIAPGGYLIVWCDDNTAAPGLHAGFALARTGEAIYLFDAASNRVDAVRFGMQLRDLTLGRVDGEWKLTVPTPGGANRAAPVGWPGDAVLNEWSAKSGPGESDWLELFNRNTELPVALNGFGIEVNGVTHRLNSHSFIGPGEFIQVFADNQPGTDRLQTKLPAAGAALALYGPNGALLDQVTYGVQAEGASAGRLPDGAANIVAFSRTPTPGASNYLPDNSGPRLNELMARNRSAVPGIAGKFSSWVELYNPNAAALDLSGMSLSKRMNAPGQWEFPAGASIAGQGYLVVWFDKSSPGSTAFGPVLNTGRDLEEEGGGVYLFNTTGQLADWVEYGFQLPDSSMGKLGNQWVLLESPTPGAENSAGRVLGNSGAVKLNEWLAYPVSGEDWFEIYNPEPLPVSLSGLHVSDDPSLAGQKQHRIPDLSFIGPESWLVFVADGNPEKGVRHVNFSLNRQGETLRIYTPAGTIIDTVDFGAQEADVSEGRLPDGGSEWTRFAQPTPGRSNAIHGEELDSDGDGIPDWWELAHGLDPNDPNDAHLDWDGDGMSNLEEFLAGTDPNDPESVLRLEASRGLAGEVRLVFQALAGRSYALVYRDDLGTGDWVVMREIPASETNQALEITDLELREKVTRYYLLQILPLTPAP